MTYKTKLKVEEAQKRLNRLDTLRILTEGYEYGEGHDIYLKVMKALNKVNNFTGIIHLNFIEKDYLLYVYEEQTEYLTEEEKEVLKHYLNK